MAGSKSCVATKLLADEPCALLTHCYGHAFNLAVGDAMKKSKVCCDALDSVRDKQADMVFTKNEYCDRPHQGGESSRGRRVWTRPWHPFVLSDKADWKGKR